MTDSTFGKDKGQHQHQHQHQHQEQKLAMSLARSIDAVIPAYNAEQTIGRCIQSVLDQTARLGRVIVVDDGSTDRTADVAASYGDRVQVLRQQNQGSAVARQAGTDLSEADYIAYLDADDWWPESRLENIGRLLDGEPVAFLMSDFVRCLPDKPHGPYRPRNTSFFPWFRALLHDQAEGTRFNSLYKLPQPQALEALLRGFPFFPSAGVMCRQVIQSIGGWDARFRRCQDFDIALRIARRHAIHFLDDVTAIVGINQGNAVAGAYTIKQTRGSIAVLRAHYGESQDDPAYRAQVGRALAGKYCALGHACRQVGDRHGAFEAYRGALSWPGRRAHAFFRMLASPLAR